jgi:hypothetical protein
VSLPMARQHPRFAPRRHRHQHVTPASQGASSPLRLLEAELHRLTQRTRDLKAALQQAHHRLQHANRRPRLNAAHSFSRFVRPCARSMSACTCRSSRSTPSGNPACASHWPAHGSPSSGASSGIRGSLNALWEPACGHTAPGERPGPSLNVRSGQRRTLKSFPCLSLPDASESMRAHTPA